MRRIHSTSIARGIAAAALLACFGAQAQNTPTRSAGRDTAAFAKSNPSVQLARADRKFIEEAALGSMAEVELGKLAQLKGSSEQVKQFGARMVEDHGRTNVELKQLAQIKGIGVPAVPDKLLLREIDKLYKFTGAEFDRQYMAHLLSGHRKDVSDFKKASEAAQDSDVKAFADKTLPTLQEHLKLAQSLNERVKATK